MNYLLDANTYIQAKNEYYHMEVCPGYWDWLDQQFANQNLASVSLVYDELKTFGDELSDWVKGRKDHFLDVSDEPTQGIFGRTTVLRLNYRNTREILGFAYAFAKHYFDPQAADDDHIPLIEPEAAGNSGPVPAVRQFNSLKEEIEYTKACLRKWHGDGVRWGDMAILYASSYQGHEIAKQLEEAGIPYVWLGTKTYKEAYNPANDKVTVLTMHSSKGLEFPRVIMVGIGQMKDDEERLQQSARVLYVGMTRAQECQLLTTSGVNQYRRKMLEVAAA